MSTYNSRNLLSFAILGGILGGLIAFIGYLIMSPQTDSVVLFVLLRVGVGAVVAPIVGPIIMRHKLTKKDKSI